MITSTGSPVAQAIILSFPLNPRKITDKLLSDIAEINFVNSSAAYGSNMRLARKTSTSVKLYLPNFSDSGFSTTFSVSGDMENERLMRLINVYGLAASLKLFSFVHYIASSHFIVCITIDNTLHANMEESIQSLNDLQKFLQVQQPSNRRK